MTWGLGHSVGGFGTRGTVSLDSAMLLMACKEKLMFLKSFENVFEFEVEKRDGISCGLDAVSAVLT